MRYRYYKQAVPVQWLDLKPRAIPKGEKLTTSWSEHTIQEISESEFQHLMDVCQVTDDKVIKNRFNLHLRKEESSIQKDQQEDKICDLIDRGKVKEALALVTTENLDMECEMDLFVPTRKIRSKSNKIIPGKWLC